MKRMQRAGGFTIIETLIVLAITSALFMAVVVTLSGRRARTEFSQSMQDIRSRIQQVVNDVGSGYYPALKDAHCIDTANGQGTAVAPGTAKIVTGGAEQGTSSGCVFLGKVMQFGIAGGQLEQVRIYTAFGVRRDANGEVAPDAALKRYINARPAVSALAADTSNLLHGIKIRDMYYGSPRKDIAAFAVVKSLGSYSMSSGALQSGSTQINIIPIVNTTLGATPDPDTTINAINVNDRTNKPGQGLADGEVNPSGGIKMCFVSGGSNQSGLIEIGGSSRQFTVSLTMKENKTCA